MSAQVRISGAETRHSRAGAPAQVGRGHTNIALAATTAAVTADLTAITATASVVTSVFIVSSFLAVDPQRDDSSLRFARKPIGRIPINSIWKRVLHVYAAWTKSVFR